MFYIYCHILPYTLSSTYILQPIGSSRASVVRSAVLPAAPRNVPDVFVLPPSPTASGKATAGHRKWLGLMDFSMGY